MKILGIELTPLWVPVERRLQTLSIIFYVAMFMVLPLLTYFLAIGLIFTSYYWISIGYFTWSIYDNYFSKVWIKAGIRAVADPGFPVGGRAPVTGGMDLRRGHFLVKMYVKMKELGPIGGRAPGTPPRSANVRV